MALTKLNNNSSSDGILTDVEINTGTLSGTHILGYSSLTGAWVNADPSVWFISKQSETISNITWSSASKALNITRANATFGPLTLTDVAIENSNATFADLTVDDIIVDNGTNSVMRADASLNKVQILTDLFVTGSVYAQDFVRGEGNTTAFSLAANGRITTGENLVVTGDLTTTGFTSTGIDDNATSTAVTIDQNQNTVFSGSLTATSGLFSSNLVSQGTIKSSSFKRVDNNSGFDIDASGIITFNNAVTANGFTSTGAVSIDTTSALPLVVDGASQGAIKYLSNGTTRGYVGNGTFLLTADTVASDFIVRSEGAMKLAYSGNNEGLRVGSNGTRITTASGNVEIGALNSGYCHYMTTLPKHFFNKQITVNGAIEFYNGNSFTTTNVANWNTAYGWGNHASAGYLNSNFNVAGGSSSKDPNTTTDAYFLSNQANAPFGSVYSHIQNHWWSSNGANVAQHATTYNGSTARFAFRHRYSNTFTPWAEVYSTSNPQTSITGNAATATASTTVYVNDYSGSTTMKILGSHNGSGSQGNVYKSDGIYAKMNTNTLYATTFSGALSGNATTATTASNVSVTGATNTWFNILAHSGGTPYADPACRIHGSGYIQAVYYNSTHAVSTRNADTQFYTGTTDGYIRANSKAGMKESLNITHIADGSGGGNYGSVTTDGGGTGGWEGFSIGGRAVFMHNNSTISGLYNDVNNQWIFKATHNGASEIAHAGATKGYTYGSGWRVTGNMLATSNVYAYYSDERLKDVVGKIDTPLEKVKAIDTFYYTHNDTARDLGYEGSERQVGVSAQSVQAVMPEVIGRAPIDDDGEGGSVTGEDYMTVQYERLVPLLIESIKTLTDQVESLGKKVKELEG